MIKQLISHNFEHPKTNGKTLLRIMIATFLFAVAVHAQPVSLDPLFGTGGISTADVSTADDEIFTAIGLGDNKIIAAGYSSSPAVFTVARYNSNGTLDTAFGVGGVAKTNFSSSSYAYAAAVQSDGKIILAGELGPGQGFALARYNSDGTLDTSFGNMGTVVTNAQNLSSIAGLAIQGDGKIVAAGATAFGDLAVARYTAAGVLDTATFGGGDGIVTTDVFGDEDRVKAVRLQADGKIVVAGFALDLDLQMNIVVVRYNSDGTPDSSFDGDGVKTKFQECSSDGSGCGADALGVQPDGKIVVAASYENAHLVRFNADGTEFGAITTDIGGATDDVNSLAVDSLGAVFIAGSTNTAGNEDFFIAKYAPNGGLDPMFDGGDGIVTTSAGSNSDLAYNVALQPNGGILVSGSTGNFGSKQFAIARYRALQPTAAPADLSGRVTDRYGRGIGGARVTLTKMDGTTVTALTSSFGYYRFSSLPTGESYIVSVFHLRYTFDPNTILVNLMEDYSSANFVAS